MNASVEQQVNSNEYYRGYGAGYYRGGQNRWPLHRPPHPPQEMVRRLMETAMALRDAVDGELAMLDEEDPWQEKLGEPMDRVTEAFEVIGRWLKNPL